MATLPPEHQSRLERELDEEKSSTGLHSPAIDSCGSKHAMSGSTS
ncbi:MAG: hypothetical protein R3B67_04405 [Phycisphaerales bacterium]